VARALCTWQSREQMLDREDRHFPCYITTSTTAKYYVLFYLSFVFTTFIDPANVTATSMSYT